MRNTNPSAIKDDEMKDKADLLHTRLGHIVL